ncbi:hypothetical protein T459_35326 [Capsicum annuum]|uniref:Agamous-like MADS-box protein AGL62 n=1 Tax=Capsicum annuum TaxID=4072 RepID=A0A2G2XU36_CAPAN|nr:hypothetical protein T459_35326 [Capsicum annuum]
MLLLTVMSLEYHLRRCHHRPLMNSTCNKITNIILMCKDLEAEKKKKENIEEEKLVNIDDNNNGGYWWNEPIDTKGIDELEEFMVALENLKKNVTTRVDELSMLNGSSSSNSTVKIARLGAEDQFLNQVAIVYCSSIVPYELNSSGDGQFLSN